MTLRHAIVTSLALAVGLPIAAQVRSSDFEREWPELVSRLERAGVRGDAPELKRAHADCAAWLTEALPKERAALVRYASAYADWRSCYLPDVTARERDNLLAEAEKRLLEVVALAPQFAEAHALLGSVYGGQIGASPLKGMTLGPKAGSALEHASKLEPRNPRIAFQQGTSAFHTPAMYGGGLEKAERLLRQAIELFAEEPEGKPWPNWGRFDAHVWLGQTLAKKNDRAGARAEYEKALALVPESKWVRLALLPSVAQDKKID